MSLCSRKFIRKFHLNVYLWGAKSRTWKGVLELWCSYNKGVGPSQLVVLQSWPTLRLAGRAFFYPILLSGHWIQLPVVIQFSSTKGDFRGGTNTAAGRMDPWDLRGRAGGCHSIHSLIKPNSEAWFDCPVALGREGDCSTNQEADAVVLKIPFAVLRKYKMSR